MAGDRASNLVPSMAFPSSEFLQTKRVVVSGKFLRRVWNCFTWKCVERKWRHVNLCTCWSCSTQCQACMASTTTCLLWKSLNASDFLCKLRTEAWYDDASTWSTFLPSRTPGSVVTLVAADLSLFYICLGTWGLCHPWQAMGGPSTGVIIDDRVKLCWLTVSRW